MNSIKTLNTFQIFHQLFIIIIVINKFSSNISDVTGVRPNPISLSRVCFVFNELVDVSHYFLFVEGITQDINAQNISQPHPDLSR